MIISPEKSFFLQKKPNFEKNKQMKKEIWIAPTLEVISVINITQFTTHGGHDASVLS
jgi:hypothetical protein